MSDEFRRLLDDAPSAELRATLESGLRDQPSPRTLGRAARALGIGAAGIGSARAAAAAGGLRAARAPLWGALAKLGATGVLIGGVALSPLVLSTRAAPRAQFSLRNAPAAGTRNASKLASVASTEAAAPVAEASAAPDRAAAESTSPSSSAAPPAPSAPAPAGGPAVRSARGVQSALAVPAASIPRVAAATSAEQSAPAKRRADSLDSEVTVLDAARTALKRNDPNGALLQLNRHAQLAGATLGAEATLLRVQALVLSGRSTEARDVARAALNGKNGGPYAERLRKLSGLNE